MSNALATPAIMPFMVTKEHRHLILKFTGLATPLNSRLRWGHSGTIGCLVLRYERDGAHRAVDRDRLPGADALGCSSDSDHRRNTILARDDRAMGHCAAHLHHQITGRQEERRPATIRRGRHQDFTTC